MSEFKSVRTKNTSETGEIAGRKLLCLDMMEEPFGVSGFAWLDRERRFCRLPADALPEMSEGIQKLAWHTAGGMGRFRTDSSTIAIKVELPAVVDMSHMPRTGNSGFDIYLGGGKEKRFLNNARPQANRTEYEALLVDGPDRGMREWTLNFPLYNGVNRVLVGVNPDAEVEPPSPFTVGKPLLFYGSSITQGGCASRPGNAYTHILARWLDANLINLGFSGGAKGEPAMARLIASMDMSVFIMDYDYNAPSAEHLERTHEPFFRIVTEARPELPVVIVSSPSVDADPSRWVERGEIICRTYENALRRGNSKVWFVDGQTLFGTTDRDGCTVDGCHPNDLGFLRMAEAIRSSVEAALED